MKIFTDLRRRFTTWLNSDRVADAWAARNSKVIRTTIEFDNGVIRELVGDASDNWHRDMYYATCGRRIDWKQHKWTQTQRK